MSTAEFVQRLAERRIELAVDGGRLRYYGPRDALDDATLAELRERKAALIDYLQQTGDREEQTAPPGAHPLSFGQEALWFVHQLDRDSLAYNTMVAARLVGDVDPAALQAALRQLLARHPILCSRLMAVDGRPWQRFEADAGAVLQTSSCVGLSRSQIDERIAALGDMPFDLEAGPVARWHLLTDAATAQGEGPAPILVIVAHHSVIDFRSLEIVLRDLSVLYRAVRDDRPASLPPLPWNYADYVRWSRAWVRSTAGTRARDYWLGALDGELPVLDLPTDAPRPARQSFTGGTLIRTLDPDLSRRLSSTARTLSVTPFVLMLGAFGTLLHRYTGQDEIMIGAPMLGRTRSELSDLVGYLVNPVVLRLHFSQNLEGRSLLNQLRRTVLEALDHQDYPFPLVVEDVQPERDPSRSPLVQVAFVYERQSGTPLGEHGLIDDIVVGGQRGAVFDITLTVLEQDDGVRMTWEYATALFRQPTIERMAGHLERLLASLIEALDTPVAVLPMLSPAQIDELQDWNRTGCDGAETRTVADLIAEQCARTPHATALDDGTCRLSYAMLNAIAGRLASRLIEAGAGPNKLVALFLQRPMDQAIAVMAVLRAGGACLPLADTDPPERRAHILSASAPVAVLADADRLALLPNVSAEIIAVAPGDLSLDAERPPAGEGECPPCPARPEDLVYVLFTSGSTGQPKGVAMPHRALVNLAVWQSRQPELAEPARTLHFTRLTFDVAFQEIVTTWSAGGTLVLIDDVRRRDSHALLDWIADRHVERVFMPFVALQHLAEAARGRGFPACLRNVITAGEQLRATPAIREAFATGDCRLHNHYGPTETHVVTAYGLPRDVDDWEDLPPIGRPIANTQAHVLDRAGGRVPVGVPGELCIAGESLAHGYLNRPDLTRERFVEHPTLGRLYRTGDMVRWRLDGTLAYLGRRDRQVKVRGIRVELDEIEAVLNAHPAVGEAVVVFQSGSETGSEARLAAYVVAASGVAGTGEALRAALTNHLRDRLPGALVPASLSLLESLPKTTSGKLDRRALPAPDFATDAGPALQSGNEGLLAAIWARLLGLTTVDRDANFFDLGGHSLLAMRLVARIREQFGIDLPVQTVFDRSTVGALAAVIEGRLGAEPLPPIERLAPDAPAPLSFAQQRLWVLDRLDGPGPTYSMPATLAVTGPIDIQAFRKAGAALVARHDSLRASFPVVDGAPALRLIEPYDPLIVTDFGQRGAEERDREAHRLSRSHALQPFDLAAGPLFRLRLLRFDERTHWLLFNMHHIISDGWSLGVLVGELSSLYRAFRSEADADLPPLPVQYQDYAAWQRRWFQGAVLERQLAHWRQRLDGAPTVLELPCDRPRPVKRSFRGGLVEHRLGSSLPPALRRLSQAEGCTDFMALFAAFGLLLARYSGQRDLLIGTPVANRRHSACEGLIGYFANTLALRCRVDAADTFAQLIAAVRRDCIDAYANQDIPFELLVRELQLERTLAHTPLIQVMLVMQDDVVGEMDLGDAAVTQLEPLVTAAKFDLTVYLETRGDELVSRWEYNADIFDAERIARMAGHYGQLLRGALAAPRSPLASLDMTTPQERHQIALWGTGPAHEPAWEHLLDGFAAQLARTPEAPAVVAGDRHLTYDELNARANRLARFLARSGVEPGVRVAFCLDPDLGLIVTLLAIIKAGAAYVPLASTYPVERLAYMIGDSGAKLVLTTLALEHRLPAGPVPVCRLDAEADAIAAEPATDPDVGRRPDDPLYVIYTSGSTGQPKGALIVHRGFANLLRWYCRVLALTPADRCLLVSALGFDLTQKNLFAPLMVGASLHLVDNETYNPALLRAAIHAQQITWINCTPSAFYPLLGLHGDKWRAELSPLRWVVLGGEPIQADRLERWLNGPCCNARVLNSYGPTECTDVAVAGVLDAAVDIDEVPLGAPIDNVRLQVLDSDHLPVPVGLPGELFIGGVGVGEGYVGRPDLTAERFVHLDGGPDRHYATGDLVSWRPDGRLAYLGRKDAQVKLRGHRIELEEIEAGIRALPDVVEAAVTVSDDSTGGRLSAYFVAPEDLDSVMLRAALGKILPSYMVPDVFVRLDRLPLSPNGKLNRSALPAVARHGSHAANRPRGPTEHVLASMWKDLLNVEAIDRDANFFELGGHSLLAVALTMRIQEVLAIDFTLDALFGQPTIAGLARRIEAIWGNEYDPMVALPKSLEPELSLAQQRLLNHLYREDSDSHAHVAWARMELRGALDERALRQALTWLVERHGSLRLRFRDIDGVLRPQWVAPFDPLTDIDLSNLPEAAARAEAQRLTRGKVESLSDLRSEHLLRLTLLKLGPAKYELLFAMHHIVGDGQSVDVLIADMEPLYLAACHGETRDPPEPALQYSDFAAWQWERLNGGFLGPQLDHWRHQLDEAPELLTLPLDGIRPAVQAHDGRSVPVRLDAELGEALRVLARRNECSVFVVLLAAYKLLLFRFSGERDLCVGVPLVHRNDCQLQTMVGLFMNTLVMRSRMPEAATFSVFLGGLRQRVLSALANQDVPIEYLVEELRPTPNRSFNPLFQVMMNLIGPRPSTLRLEGVEVDVLSRGRDFLHAYDLNLALTDWPDGRLDGELHYDAALFDRATAAFLAGAFVALLRGIVARPDAPLSELSLLDPAQTHTAAPRATPQPVPPRFGAIERSIADRFAEQVARSPQAIAVRTPDDAVTYGDLDLGARRVAAALLDLPVPSPVGLLLPHDCRVAAAILGVLQADRAYVPLDPALPDDRLRAMVDDAEVGVVLCCGTLEARARSLAGIGGAVIDLDRLDRPPIPADRLPTVSPDHIAYLHFPPDRDGQRRGCALNHRNVLHFVRATSERLQLGHEDRLLNLLPAACDAGVLDLLPALLNGATACMYDLRAGSVADCGAWVDRSGVSVLHATPSVYRALLANLDRRLSGVRLVVLGGERVVAADLAAFRRSFDEHCRFATRYGVPEAPIVAHHFAGPVDPPSASTVPIGVPVDGIEIDLVDDAGTASELFGEIVVKSASLADGGWEHASAAIGDDPQRLGHSRLATGDLARRRPDGSLVVIGRCDGQVRLRGTRLEIADVEQAILTHPGVHDVAVTVTRPIDPKGSTRSDVDLTAYICGAASPADVKAYCRTTLPEHLVPQHIVTATANAFTPSGTLEMILPA